MFLLTTARHAQQQREAYERYRQNDDVEIVTPAIDRSSACLLVPLLLTITGVALLAADVETVSVRMFAIYLVCMGVCSFSMGCMTYFTLLLMTSAMDPAPFPIRGMAIPHNMVVNSVIRTFFDTSAVGEYVQQRIGQMTVSLQLAEKTRTLMESPDMHEIITSSWLEFVDGPDGQLMASLGIDLNEFTPVIKPLIIGVLCDLCPAILEESRPTTTRLAQVLETHTQAFIAKRLEVLHPHVITRHMLGAVRPELQMLVVYNVVGGLLVGIAAAAVLLHESPNNPHVQDPADRMSLLWKPIVHMIGSVAGYDID
eukprot:CFRG8129T1